VVENRLVGMKSHGIYETPGGTILMRALRELEALVLDKQSMQFKDMAALKYAELIYDGLWFTPLRESLDSLINDMVKMVTGVVRLKLFKGNVIPAGRKSPNSLYRDDYANFGLGDVYEQYLSEGFIGIFGVPLKVRALNKLKASGKDFPKPDFSRFKRD